MAWGFNPAVALQATQSDPLELPRTLAQLANMGVQRQQAQASLADLVRKQQQEQTLADLVRQHAGSFSDPLASAYAGAGFGDQALEAQKKSFDLAKLHRDLVRARLSSIKDANGYAQAIAGISPQGLAQYGLTEQYDPTALQGFIESSIEPDKRMQLAETERHNREMEKRPPSSFLVPQLLPGEGGVQTWVVPPPLRPGQATTAVDDKGNPIIKPQPARAGKSLNIGDRDRLAAFSEERRSFQDLSSRFRDKYAGKGVTGNAEVGFAQKLGSMGSKDQQDLAQFWSDFSAFVDLPQRNKMFGASLTPGEKASWDQAKNIKPGSDPSRVRAQIEKMLGLIDSKLMARGRSLAKDGYSADAIEVYTGPLGLDEEPAKSGPARAGGGAKAPGPKRVRDAKTGRTGTWDGKSALPPGFEVIDG